MQRLAKELAELLPTITKDDIGWNLTGLEAEVARLLAEGAPDEESDGGSESDGDASAAAPGPAAPAAVSSSEEEETDEEEAAEKEVVVAESTAPAPSMPLITVIGSDDDYDD